MDQKPKEVGDKVNIEFDIVGKYFLKYANVLRICAVRMNESLN